MHIEEENNFIPSTMLLSQFMLYRKIRVLFLKLNIFRAHFEYSILQKSIEPFVIILLRISLIICALTSHLLKNNILTLNKLVSCE